MDEKEDKYKNLLKVDAIVWEVKEGVPTKLKALDKIFVPEWEISVEPKKSKPLEPIPEKKEKKEKPEKLEQRELEVSQKEGKDRGKVVCRLGSNNVFENVLTEVEEGLSKRETFSQIIDRIEPYYPNNARTSYGVYLSVHKRYIAGQRPKGFKPQSDDVSDKGKRIAIVMGVPIFPKVLEKIKLCGNDFEKMYEVMRECHPDIKEKSVEKYVYGYRNHIGGDIAPKPYDRRKLVRKKQNRRRKKPKGALGRDDTYNTWIMPDERDNVKKAISKWGFNATTESIVDVTGLRIGRVRAIIHWMLKKHEIYMSRENLTPIYHCITS